MSVLHHTLTPTCRPRERGAVWASLQPPGPGCRPREGDRAADAAGQPAASCVRAQPGGACSARPFSPLTCTPSARPASPLNHVALCGCRRLQPGGKALQSVAELATVTLQSRPAPYSISKLCCLVIAAPLLLADSPAAAVGRLTAPNLQQLAAPFLLHLAAPVARELQHYHAQLQHLADGLLHALRIHACRPGPALTHPAPPQRCVPRQRADRHR